MSPRIIGLCGSIGSGKSSVSDYLELRGCSRASFADKLKAVVADVFDVDMINLNGSQADKNAPLSHVLDAAGDPRTGRGILQWLGTEGFRTVDPDVWVKYAMRQVDANPLARWVFGDVRFPNEMAAIRQRGGVVWEVVCVGGPDHGGQAHQSERVWRSVPRDNIVVARYGDLPSLYRAADLALARGPEHAELRSGG